MLIPHDHPCYIQTVNHLLEIARLGRQAFIDNRYIEAKYYRDVIGLQLWRLSVDGLTASGQVRFDSTKYETRIAGRLSSAEARNIRESSEFANKAQGSLRNHVACDHIVPRNCVAETLIRPEWWDIEDSDSGYEFIFRHADVAIISPTENKRLKDNGLESNMPQEWWDAELHNKSTHRLSRYESVRPKILVSQQSP